jgi:hypothetical protein
LLRNPLAEPYLLGVSNGAALGTMLAFIFFAQNEFARPVMAFAGANLATFAVYQMAKSRAGMNVERLILSGVIVTTFLSSILVLLTSLLDVTKLRSFTFWLLGDLSQASKNGFYLTLIVARPRHNHFKLAGAGVKSDDDRRARRFRFRRRSRKNTLDCFRHRFGFSRNFSSFERFGRLRRFESFRIWFGWQSAVITGLSFRFRHWSARFSSSSRIRSRERRLRRANCRSARLPRSSEHRCLFIY